MHKLTALIMAFLLIPALSKAQQIMSLEDALKIALENNYSIQLAKNDALVAKTMNAIGNAGMLPTITGTGLQDNTVANTKQTYINGTENNRDGAKGSQIQGNLELGWTIFDGFQMFATKGKLAELQSIGELRMRAQIELTFARVMKGYFDVVQNKQLVRVQEASLKLSERRLNLANDQFDAGKSSKIEVLKAQVDYNTDRSALMSAKNSLRNSKVSLNQLLSYQPSADYDVADTVVLNRGMSLPALHDLAIKQNTNLLITYKNRSVYQYAIKEIQGERYPWLSLRTGYNASKANSQAGFQQSNQSLGYHYGAALNLNVFNGFDVNRRLQAAQIGFKSSDIVLKDSLIRLDINLQQIYNNYTLSLELVDFEKENLQVAQSNLDIALEQFKVGVISSIDLRQAQQNLLLNQSRWLTAQYQAKLAETDLLRLSGQLFKMN